MSKVSGQLSHQPPQGASDTHRLLLSLSQNQALLSFSFQKLIKTQSGSDFSSPAVILITGSKSMLPSVIMINVLFLLSPH